MVLDSRQPISRSPQVAQPLVGSSRGSQLRHLLGLFIALVSEDQGVRRGRGQVLGKTPREETYYTEIDLLRWDPPGLLLQGGCLNL